MKNVFLGRIYTHISPDFKIPEMRSKCPKWKNVRRHSPPTRLLAIMLRLHLRRTAATAPYLPTFTPSSHLQDSSCLFPIIMAFNAIRMVIRLQFRNTSMTQLCECGGERRAGRLLLWHLEGQSGCHQIWGGGWVRTRASNLFKPSFRPVIGC